MGVEGTRSRHAATGVDAPGWSPAAAEQRTRAAWSSRPPPHPRPPRRPAAAQSASGLAVMRCRAMVAPGGSGSVSGALITLEGVEGSGKTTQMMRLERWLRERGRKVERTREPDGTRLGLAVRRLFERPGVRPEPLVEVFLFMAARQQHVAEKIRPWLDTRPRRPLRPLRRRDRRLPGLRPRRRPRPDPRAQRPRDQRRPAGPDPALRSRPRGGASTHQGPARSTTSSARRSPSTAACGAATSRSIAPSPSACG